MCALAAGVIGAIIVATGGAAALGAGTTVVFLGWQVSFVAVSTMIGGAAGLAFGTGMALNNQCLVQGTNHSIGYETCQS
jgi:hypothetical protein